MCGSELPLRSPQPGRRQHDRWREGTRRVSYSECRLIFFGDGMGAAPPEYQGRREDAMHPVGVRAARPASPDGAGGTHLLFRAAHDEHRPCTSARRYRSPHPSPEKTRPCRPFPDENMLRPALFHFDPERVHDRFVLLGDARGRTTGARRRYRASTDPQDPTRR